MLLLQLVASSGSSIQSFDITTAFLRDKSDGSQLAMEPVPELKELLQMDESEVLLLDGSAYGGVDAPLLFYKEFRRQLEKLGFETHPLDNCLFLLRNKDNPEVLDGILGTHVDDGIGGGNQNYEKALQELQKYSLLVKESIENSGSQAMTLNSCLTNQSRLVKKLMCIR